MIEYRIDYDDGQVSAMFKKLADDMPEINRRILGVLCEDVSSRSQTQYLRGGHPLNRVTGNLAQSVGVGWKVHDADYATVGTNISYGAFHEFGFHGVEQVSQHVRAGSLVRAHVRHLNYAGRPFMRPALDDVFGSGRAVTLIERTLRDEIAKRETA